MSTLIKLIAITQPLIQAWGLGKSEVHETGFRDNGVAVFDNDDVRIRIESEQGSPGIDVASRQAPEDWIDASLLLNIMQGKSLVDYNDFNDVVQFLIDDQARVLSALTLGLVALQAEVFAAKRARHRIQFPGVEIG